MNVVGVKLFRGIVAGEVEPNAATVTSGAIILIIVPGVEAGIVELFAGIKLTGICKSVGRLVGSVTDPVPVEGSVIVVDPVGGRFPPAPITFTGPKQTFPVS